MEIVYLSPYHIVLYQNLKDIRKGYSRVIVSPGVEDTILTQDGAHGEGCCWTSPGS